MEVMEEFKVTDRKCSKCGRDDMFRLHIGELCDDCYHDTNHDTHHDTVDHPAHYTHGKVECIDAIESAVTGLGGFEGMLTGNAMKYLYRWKAKGGVEDLRKAMWYIERLIKTVEGKR